MAGDLMLINSCSATLHFFYPQQHPFQICMGPQCVVLTPPRSVEAETSRQTTSHWIPGKIDIFVSSFSLWSYTHWCAHVLLRCTPVCTHIIWTLKDEALKLLSHFGSFALSAIELMARAAEFCLGWHKRQVVNSNYGNFDTPNSCSYSNVLNYSCWFIRS